MRRFTSAIAFVGILLLTGLGWVFAASRSTLPSGAALANVPKLRTGMDLTATVDTLHPGHPSNMRLSMRPEAGGGSLTEHRVAPDRYVVLHWATSGSNPKLRSYDLREGVPEREDIDLGRMLHLGSISLPY